MTNVGLDIELERQSARFRPGERIRGVVHARSHKPFTCRHLELTWTRVLEFRSPPELQDGKLDIAFRSASGATSGRRPPDCYTAGQLMFDSDDRTARTEHRIAFEFTAPAGPLSYDGETLRTKWVLSASHGMLAWNGTQTPFELVPWMPGDMLISDAGYRVAPLTPPDTFDFGTPPCVRRYLTASPRLSLLARMRNAWGRLKIGPVRLECPSTIAAGERLTVHVHVPTGPRARIGQIEVRLAAAERLAARRAEALVLAPHGIFTSHTAALQIADARPDPGFVDGETDVWTATLDIPPDAPPSLHTRLASLCWHVEIHCRSKYSPGRLLVKPLLVRPPRVVPLPGSLAASPAGRASSPAVSATCY